MSAARLVDAWYSPHLTPLTAAFVPLSWLMRAGVRVRRALFDAGVLPVARMPVPVVVVGNLTVGGGGKTPAARALANALAVHGHRPGIVSRGYGGSARVPTAVTPDSDPALVGDEAPILAGSGHPVYVAPRRADAARALLAAHPDCTVIVADDGLQHYALARDVEIALVDGTRGLGNGRLLPAGPLREPASRLRSVDAVVTLVPYDAPFPQARDNGRESAMAQIPLAFRNVADPALTAGPERFRRADVHALAGTANPARFFASLAALGIDATPHPFADHHRYVRADLGFAGAAAILMTEKDAVKCRGFADARFWYLPIEARLDPALVARVVKLIGGR
ncbi:MAG: tetraacyldisaccharide 4'-kinase [Proteobacteria bacterium]|nr:tetraacyldisaccharide 4'-kinase [Pseudomonadota bacterium]